MQYTRPPPYVIMLNLVVLGQTLRELVGSPKKLQCWGPSLGLGVWLTPTNTPLPNVVCHAQFDRRWSNGTIVCMGIRRKTGSLAFRLSRSLEVIRTDTDWSATYDLLITFHSNRGPIVYRFQDIARYWPKIANFSYPVCIFNVLNEEVPLGISDAG